LELLSPAMSAAYRLTHGCVTMLSDSHAGAYARGGWG